MVFTRLGRRDYDKLSSWLRSDSQKYFDKAVRVLGYILPEAMYSRDKNTVDALLPELASAFWYWDSRVPRVPDWRTPEELDEKLVEREKMRDRRREVALLLERVRAHAGKLRSGHGGKKIKSKVTQVIEELERKWNLLAAKRTAEGVGEGPWEVLVLER
ncbi:MAG: hypothetical protein QXH27_01745 [Candidatus Micrarchaeia archaeon]